MAEHVAGCRAEFLLRKQHATISQTRLGRQERRKNVAGAFVVTDGMSVDPNTRYVVIDDVLTTGATLHACALTLREAGATLVDAAALAHG
jgi:predicted amidophosphoribosyltransferase